VQKLASVLSSFIVILAAFAVVSCGSQSSMMGSMSPTMPQTITLSPMTADAHMYPNGQVQFMATGSYINPVRKLTPQPASWGVCQQNTPTMAVTVSQTGVAQCGMGATGKYTVFAYDMTNCTAMTACGGGCTVVGTAQLTCP
jgi:hypothetical protein